MSQCLICKWCCLYLKGVLSRYFGSYLDMTAKTFLDHLVHREAEWCSTIKKSGICMQVTVLSHCAAVSITGSTWKIQLVL